jgi:exonuclease III
LQQTEQGASCTLRQETVDQQSMEMIRNSATWGDTESTKIENTIRIAFRNINYLPKFKQQSKNESLMHDIYNFKIDIMGICEPNLAWKNLPEQDQPKERFRGYFNKLKIVHNNKITDPTYCETSQIGGTMLFTVDDTVHRISQSGTDNSKLGRWSWIRLQGRQGVSVRIVTIYRPVYSTGVLSTYQQHRQQLLSQDIERCPRQVFLDDLETELQKWFDMGDQIILMGDFNEDVRSSKVSKLFAKFGMKEVILFKHRNKAPSTYSRGTVPIDGIFATANISPLHCGYSAVDLGTYCDHRMLWADLPIDALLGNHLNPSWTPSIRQLKLIDPWIVNKFLDIRKRHLEDYQLTQRTVQLYNSMHNDTMNDEQKSEFETIDRLRVEGILYAEQHCRKLKMGKVPWLPELQLILNTIRYLCACRKLYQGRKIHARSLCRLQRRSRFVNPVCRADATELLKNEYNSYNQFKCDARNKCTHFLEDLAGAISMEDGQDSANILNQLQARERLRELSRKLKSMKGATRVRLM